MGIAIRTAVALGLLGAAGVAVLSLGDDGADGTPSVTPLRAGGAAPSLHPGVVAGAGGGAGGGEGTGGPSASLPDAATPADEDPLAVLAGPAVASLRDLPPPSPGAARFNPFRLMPERVRAEVRESSRRLLEPLLEEYRAAGPGAARAEVLRRMMGPLHDHMACGGSLEHLRLLAESAEEGATPEERKRAVIATHSLWQPEVVAWLEERARSPRDEVRFYAVEGFAWVEGEESDRAIGNLLRGLEDPAPKVRAVAALSLGAVVADPVHLPALVSHLGREEDRRVIGALVQAILRLDPGGGAARVRSAAPGASGEAWSAALEALERAAPEGR